MEELICGQCGRPCGVKDVLVCEECGSRYDISSGFGGCVEGPGTQLQVYETYYSAASRVLLVQD